MIFNLLSGMNNIVASTITNNITYRPLTFVDITMKNYFLVLSIIKII